MTEQSSQPLSFLNLFADNSLTFLFTESKEELAFAEQQEALFKSLRTYITDFHTKLKKLPKKYGPGNKLVTYPEGTFLGAIQGVLSVVDAYADAIGDFGTSLDGLLQITHNAIKDRTAERQRMVDFVSTTNGNLKTSKSNLEKCFNAYWSKAKAHDDNLQNTIKAKANPKSKPRDIAKLDQRDQKSEEAYDAAAQTYEQQITLTNQLIYETYNNIYPSCFMDLENFKRNGLQHYSILLSKFQEQVTQIPKRLTEANKQFKSAVKQFDCEQTIQAFIQKHLVTSFTKPEPERFMVYQCTTTQGFVTYEPDKIDPFAWTEFNADARVVCARPQKKKSASSRKSKIMMNTLNSGVPLEEEPSSSVPAGMDTRKPPPDKRAQRKSGSWSQLKNLVPKKKEPQSSSNLLSVSGEKIQSPETFIDSEVRDVEIPCVEITSSDWSTQNDNPEGESLHRHGSNDHLLPSPGGQEISSGQGLSPRAEPLARAPSPGLNLQKPDAPPRALSPKVSPRGDLPVRAPSPVNLQKNDIPAFAIPGALDDATIRLPQARLYSSSIPVIPEPSQPELNLAKSPAGVELAKPEAATQLDDATIRLPSAALRQDPTPALATSYGTSPNIPLAKPALDDATIRLPSGRAAASANPAVGAAPSAPEPGTPSIPLTKPEAAKPVLDDATIRLPSGRAAASANRPGPKPKELHKPTSVAPPPPSHLDVSGDATVKLPSAHRGAAKPSVTNPSVIYEAPGHLDVSGDATVKLPSGAHRGAAKPSVANPSAIYEAPSHLDVSGDATVKLPSAHRPVKPSVANSAIYEGPDDATVKLYGSSPASSLDDATIRPGRKPDPIEQVQPQPQAQFQPQQQPVFVDPAQAMAQSQSANYFFMMMQNPQYQQMLMQQNPAQYQQYVVMYQQMLMQQQMAAAYQQGVPPPAYVSQPGMPPIFPYNPADPSQQQPPQ